MSNRVALIGVGAMGLALLRRLRSAGMEVQAYDVSEVAQCAARQRGAVLAASPAAAAEGASHIHVLVASDDEVIHVMDGPDGVLDAASEGSVVFLHSTILPMTTQKVANAAAERNIRVLDAPITAIPERLEAGHGVFLVGGPQALVDETREYLLRLGESVRHFGPLGAGNVAKLAKALINVAERIVLAEALNLAEAGGLDLVEFLEMERSTRSTTHAAHWDRLFTIENGHARHRPTPNLFSKDVMLAAKLAHDYGLEAPLTAGAALTSRKWLSEWAKATETDR